VLTAAPHRRWQSGRHAQLHFRPFHASHDSSPARMPCRLRVLAYVGNTPVCKTALQLLKGMLTGGKCKELTLAYCAPNPYSYEGMLGVLEVMAEPLAAFPVRTEVREHGSL
jgi:hypothetical protein